MKLEPHQTPDRCKHLACIRKVDVKEGTVKVFKNVTAAKEVFFHVALEPPIEEISSPEDIQTIHAFQVAPDETEDEVRREAIRTAETYEGH